MDAEGSDNESQHNAGNDSAFVFREVIRNVPLSADGDEDNLYITCVEYWEGNLYIGTSGGGLLHYVSLPPEDDSDTGPPTFILASRLEPPSTTKQEPPYHQPGIEQILLLPSVSKACVLCNGTLTFYSLPELSPAFGGKIKQGDCTWVGGLDRNLEGEDQDVDEVIVVICLKQKLRIIRIGEQARKVRDIELGGCISIERRGDLACVADGKNYSLLDVVNQQKIDLFPISSASEVHRRDESPSQDARPVLARASSRSFSSRSPARRPDLRGHERISSLGAAPRNTNMLMPDSPSQWPARRSSRDSSVHSPSSTPTRIRSPVPDSKERPLPPPPPSEEAPREKETRKPDPLMPYIVTPTPNEYLLTTGTFFDEPGVGMFVNLDGDVVRGTIEFSTYPESLVLSGACNNAEADPSPDPRATEGYALAIVRQGLNGNRVLQCQRWDVDPGEQQASKELIKLPSEALSTESASPFGVRLRAVLTHTSLSMKDVTQALSLRRMWLHEPSEDEQNSTAKRLKEEDKLLSRFASIATSTLMFARDNVWWLVQNPFLVRLDARLNKGLTWLSDLKTSSFSISRDKVEHVFNSLRGQEPKNELDFLTINYIRQKAAVLLLMDLLVKTADGVIAFEGDKRFTQDALISSDLEPRITLSVIPGLRFESLEGPQGIWAPGGLQSILEKFKQSQVLDHISREPRGAYGDNLLQVLKQYLSAWRRKKGFGSIADEQLVFQTVDAALLHVLLLLDQNSPSGPATTGSIRAELNELVDRGVDCFDRAIALLEQFKRLYLLSRLYQSRKMVTQVLATWRRILDGEPDEGGELIDGETDLRKYLTRIKDTNLVKEYGAYLANRNPKLGVQVFADDSSRVKFSPPEAVQLLKERAPGAVKEYLEHLVFGKKLVQYVNDLISFYLDVVLNELSSSAPSREILTSTYETYRALHPPKPTYRDFITDNAIPAPWHANRLRLLQLIGGSHDAAHRYDVDAVAARLEPYSSFLVPEMIILNGRRGRHVEALRLLAHDLGDYDTAIRYCLRGGSSIFHPQQQRSRGADASVIPSPTREEQSVLFRTLLLEFLNLNDEDERRERAAELLERFGPWFDVRDVLGLVPDEWSVTCLEGFVSSALRGLVRERNESVVLKALAAAQNLRVASEVVDKIEGTKPVWRYRDGDEGDEGKKASLPDSAYFSMGSVGDDDLDAAVR